MFYKRSALILPTLLLGPAIAHEAYAAVYLSESQAASIIFPGLKFSKITLPLSSEEQNKIKADAKEDLSGSEALIYSAKSGDCVFIDRVIGKHEYITYAVGVTKHGKIKGVEILEYRESYGFEVRGEKWRAQFIGKDGKSSLKMNEDIMNISGATLSSAHITRGVRRVLRTYDVIKARI